MYSSKGIFISFLFIVSALLVKGQESFGMVQSNYSPTTTMLQNPSSIVDSEVMLDLHVFGMSTFLHSNSAYLPAKDFSFLKHVIVRDELPTATFVQGRENYSLFSNVDLQFLTATYQYKQHGFGISSRVRTFVDVRKVPEIFANAVDFPQINGDAQLNPTILGLDMNANNVNISLLSYGELGFSYANAISHFDRNLIIAGISAKYLWGIAGGGINVDNLDYKIDSLGNFNYSNFTATSAISDSVLGGKGLSFDLGITYKRMLDNVTNYNPFRKEAGCRIYDYKWKFGASLIDLGYVRFSNGGRQNSIENVSGSVSAFNGFRIPADPLETFENTFGVGDSSIKESTGFTMIVPAAIVLQYDYNFEKNNLFFSFQFSHGLTPGGQFGIQRPQLVIFTPRYETRYFELAMPFGMYNLQEIRSGIMVRVGPVTVGTDKLGTLMSVTNVTGFDFYFHCAFKILQQKRCGKKRVW